jgi:hypothetical protein
MRTYSKEEKQAYFSSLYDQWKKAKEYAEASGDIITAIISQHGMNVSAAGFALVQMQMAAQGLDGIPYLDAKTFEGWRQAGCIVKKGEHSTIFGLTWIKAKGSEEQEPEEESGKCFPKAYHLFHRSQVEPRS